MRTPHRRQFKRRPLTRAVSFYCLDENNHRDWHLGTILDVSVGGLKVKSNHRMTLHNGQQLSLLCVAEETRPGNKQEALRIYGRIVWRDKDRQYFGIEYL
jgi:c-di-GMP-binding flagellar brake protein YcgR